MDETHPEPDRVRFVIPCLAGMPRPLAVFVRQHCTKRHLPALLNARGLAVWRPSMT